MNKLTPHHIKPSTLSRTGQTQQPGTAVQRLVISRWAGMILVIDGLFLLVAGIGALAADLAGYFFGGGPFAILAGQPLALGAVEAHGLAVLVGLLLLRTPPHDQWRWHAVALGVHLFLGACNLLFWDVYTVMDATRAGIISTVAHAVLFSAQLACIARADTEAPPELPAWVRHVQAAGLYVRFFAISTLLLGAGIHVAVIVFGREVQPHILTPAFELLLTIPMFYVSVAGWLAWRTLIFRGRWHKIMLGLILIYFPIGLPFHVITITTGSISHYATFPERYSLFIVPVLTTFIACFASLRLRGNRS